MANPMVAVRAVVLVSAGAAGVALHSLDTNTLGTVSGTVTAVEWNPRFNVTVEFKLQTNDATTPCTTSRRARPGTGPPTTTPRSR